MEIALLTVGILCLAALVVVIVMLLKKDNHAELSSLRSEVLNGVNSSVSSMGQMIEGRLKSSESNNEQKLEAIRQTMERNIANMQLENNKRLSEIQNIVDQKLQKTLDEKVSQSFRTVSEQLEKVYKGLGEMQSVALGVSDLKKVLSNVKTRGILGEIQLGAILEEMLSCEQYDKNVRTKVGSKDAVEYAVKLPGENGEFVYLPIDAKFPGDLYSDLQDAYDSGSVELVNASAAKLIARIKQEAKDIRTKYIDPPNTTEFAILFLPFEGLYAEAVNRGMIEELQKNYHISLAGPSTMAALLNSLQMGFATLAIQKRSSEVWKILGAVKTEFDQFGSILESSRDRLNKVNDELDKLIGVRTRQIQRKLKDVERLDLQRSIELLND